MVYADEAWRLSAEAQNIRSDEDYPPYAPVRVYDANGTRLHNVSGCCAATGVVLQFKKDSKGLYMRFPGTDEIATEETVHPAPLSIVYEEMNND